MSNIEHLQNFNFFSPQHQQKPSIFKQRKSSISKAVKSTAFSPRVDTVRKSGAQPLPHLSQENEGKDQRSNKAYLQNLRKENGIQGLAVSDKLKADAIREIMTNSKQRNGTLPKINAQQRRNNTHLTQQSPNCRAQTDDREADEAKPRYRSIKRSQRAEMSQRNYGKASLSPLGSEYIKVGHIPTEYLNDAAKTKQDRNLQAWKNAEKQRFFNTKASPVRESTTSQDKGEKVNFINGLKEAQAIQSQNEETADDWLYITKQQQTKATERLIGLEKNKRQRSLAYSAELQDQIRQNKANTSTFQKNEENGEQRHVMVQSDWLAKNERDKSTSRERHVINTLHLQNSQIRQKNKVVKRQEKKQRYAQKELEMKAQVADIKDATYALQEKLRYLNYQKEIKEEAANSAVKKRVELQFDKDLYNKDNQLLFEYQDLDRAKRLLEEPKLQPYQYAYNLKYNMKKSPDNTKQDIARERYHDNIKDTRKTDYIQTQIDIGNQKFVEGGLAELKKKADLKQQQRNNRKLWEEQKMEQLVNQNQYKEAYIDGVPFASELNSPGNEINRASERDAVSFNHIQTTHKMKQTFELMKTQNLHSQNPVVIKQFTARVNPQLHSVNMTDGERRMNAQFMESRE